MNITKDALVLVVEDSVDLNTALCDILAAYGYRVQSALNGHEALVHLRAAKPDVILCDIMMPGMDGYTLLRHTRADAALRTLPFIFLTALSSSAEQRRAREIGIDDFLTKPVDSSDVVAAIENALSRRRMVEEDTQRKLDELRDRIVGLLQHEFRTPLTLVLGYAELIAGTTPTNLNWDELRLSAAAILEGGKRLQTLIESFLLLAALQNRTLDPHEMQCLDAALLWEEIAVEFAGVDAGDNLQIEVRPRIRGAELTGDEFLIKEALRRLLETILRCRRVTGCRIQLSVVTLPPYVGLRVEGGGCEFCEVAAELLRPLAPIRDDRLGPNAGSGLSLSVVKQIARLHGGQLQVEDKPAQGATFTLWLPAAAGSGPGSDSNNGAGNGAGSRAYNGAG